MVLLEQHFIGSRIMFVVYHLVPSQPRIGMLFVSHVSLIEGADKSCWLSFLCPCLKVGVLVQQWMVLLVHTPVCMYMERCIRAEMNS